MQKKKLNIWFPDDRNVHRLGPVTVSANQFTICQHGSGYVGWWPSSTFTDLIHVVSFEFNWGNFFQQLLMVDLANKDDCNDWRVVKSDSMNPIKNLGLNQRRKVKIDKKNEEKEDEVMAEILFSFLSKRKSAEVSNVLLFQ